MGSSRPTTLGIHMTQAQSTPSSKKLSESEAVDYWEKKLLELDAKLSAYGHTVKVLEPSDTTELQATFPQGRRPSAKPRDELPPT